MGAALVVVSLALCAPGHQVGLSRGTYAARASNIDVELTFARGDLVALAPDVAAPLAVAGERGPLPGPALARFVELVSARAGDAPCTVTLAGADAVERDGVAVALRVGCPTDAPITVAHAWLPRLPRGHRHLARVVDADGERDALLYDGGPDGAELALRGASPASRAMFVVIGVEHILLGLDHLVFLLALVVVGVRRRAHDGPQGPPADGARDLLAVVTAFTVAHSVTLALAVLEVVSPPAAVIEPLIALSIVVVGLENVRLQDLRGRWRFAGAFGFVHGFGFAGALADVGLPRGDVPARLLAFNVGVELGQLAFLAVLVPPLEILRGRGVIGRRFVVFASVVVCLAGAGWFIERMWPS